MVLLLKALTLDIVAYEESVIVAQTVFTLVVPMSETATVPLNLPVATVPLPVNTGAKVPTSVPSNVQAAEGVIVAVMIIVVVDSSDAFAGTSSVRVPPVVAVPVLVKGAPEKTENPPIA